MKEAAGEANMTVITIILITAIVAIATPLITNVMNQSKRRTCCTNFGGVMNGGTCSVADNAEYQACINGEEGQA